MCNAIWELILIHAIIITLFNEHYNAWPTNSHMYPCSKYSFSIFRMGNWSNCNLFGWRASDHLGSFLSHEDRKRVSGGLISTLVGGIFGFIFVLIIFLLGGLVMKQLARLREVTIVKDALGVGDVLLRLFLDWYWDGRPYYPVFLQ